MWLAPFVNHLVFERTLHWRATFSMSVWVGQKPSQGAWDEGASLVLKAIDVGAGKELALHDASRALFVVYCATQKVWSRVKGRLKVRWIEQSNARATLPSSFPHSLTPTLTPFSQIRQEYPLNLSISVSGGKETNKDSPSNGEWSGISSNL